MNMKNMKANMVSMANENKGISGAKKGMEGAEASEMTEPQYPWGLRLNIEGEKWAKIVGGEKLPQVGEQKYLMIMATITGAKMGMGEGEGSSVDLQITDIGLCEEKAPKKSAAQVIYGGEEA